LEYRGNVACRHDQIEREGRRTEEEWEGRGGDHQGQEPELLPSLLAPAPVAGTELAPVSRDTVNLEGNDLRVQVSEEREKKWEEREVSGSGSGGASRERGRGSYAPLIRGGDHVYVHWSH